MQIIAEVKTASPFGFKATSSWEDLFKVAVEIGDIISIHTDPRWNGSIDLIRQARKLTTKPILAKGIHEKDSDIESALKAGADYILVVGRLPKRHLDKCLIEPLTIDQLKQLPNNIKAVWNSRDLETGRLKTETFDRARKVFSGWLCQASNIKTIKDVHQSADAVLVGTNLPSFASSLRKLR